MMRIVLILLLTVSTLSGFGQTASAPLVPDYGIIWDIENTLKPDPSLQYKILVDLKTLSSDPEDLNLGLNRIARMVNLHATGGVPREKLDIVVAIHGGATPIAMNNTGYRKHFGVDNPNLELFRQLKDAGVTFYVCGQSLVKREYGLDHVLAEIDISLSMLTVATEHMMKGYGILVFD